MVRVSRGEMQAELLTGDSDGNGSGNGYGSGDGYGYGNGTGDGYGDGDGSGYGYGNGTGDGDGYGDGDSYGYGNGYGDGDSYGDGDGHSYGYGYGDGYGNGYGDGDGYGHGHGHSYGTYWLAAIESFVSRWTTAEIARVASAKVSGAQIAFWKSDKNGKPCNGGSGRAAKIGDIHTAKGPLSLCHNGTLHATLNPPQWKGARVWIVALHGEVVSDGEKFGALKREILGEVVQS